MSTVRTVVNEGVIVRHGIARNGEEYLVLWSPTSNHAFILKSDIAADEWFEAGQCEWREYDIDLNYTRGPEGIETQAYNLRKPKDDSRNPCTTPNQAYTDVHSLRTVNVFVPHENTVKFKDTFIVTDENDRISGKFIKNARISSSDVRELRKCNITTFEGIAVLDPVTRRNDTSPWKITQFVYEAKELSLQGYCCKLGFLRHGRGGALCSRNEAYVPPDPLRLKNVSTPSRFSLATPASEIKTAAVQIKKLAEVTPVLNNSSNSNSSAPSFSLNKSIQHAPMPCSTSPNTQLVSPITRNPNIPVFAAEVKRLLIDDDPGFPAVVNGKTGGLFFVHLFHKDVAAMLYNNMGCDIKVSDIVSVKIRFKNSSRPEHNCRHEVIAVKKINPPASVIETYSDSGGFAMIKLIALYQGSDNKLGRIFYNDFLGQIFDNFKRVPNDINLHRTFILEASVKLIAGRQAGLVCTRFLGYSDQVSVPKEDHKLMNKSNYRDENVYRDPSNLLEQLEWSLKILSEPLVQEAVHAESLRDDYITVVKELNKMRYGG